MSDLRYLRYYQRGLKCLFAQNLRAFVFFDTFFQFQGIEPKISVFFVVSAAEKYEKLGRKILSNVPIFKNLCSQSLFLRYSRPFSLPIFQVPSVRHFFISILQFSSNSQRITKLHLLRQFTFLISKTLFLWSDQRGLAKMQHMRPKERTTRTIKECLAVKGNIFHMLFLSAPLAAFLSHCVCFEFVQFVGSVCVPNFIKPNKRYLWQYQNGNGIVQRHIQHMQQ